MLTTTNSTVEQKWFQAYSKEHYTKYLKIKSLCDWAINAHDKVYVYVKHGPPEQVIRRTIRYSKYTLGLAKVFMREIEDFPPPLRKLTDLEWEHSVKLCQALFWLTQIELLKKSEEEEQEATNQLLELERSYISQKSQHVDSDDLEARLARTDCTLIKLIDQITKSPELRENEVARMITWLSEASKTLAIDFDEIVSKAKESTDHMALETKDREQLSIQLIKNWDNRYGVYRQVIELFKQALATLNSETVEELNKAIAKVIEDLDFVCIKLNHVNFQSSKIMINTLLPESVPFNLEL